MNASVTSWFFILVLLQLSSEAKLPEFFKKCPRNSINLSKCVEENANFALPHILQGVEELNIPPLVNLEIPKIYAPNYVPYDFIFEGNITKLEGVTLNDSVMDLKTLASHAKLIFPNLDLEGNYKIHGFVGKIPMTGKGPAKVTLHNLTLEIIGSFNVFPRQGVNYFKVVPASLISYSISSVSYQFDNLFEGDKVQGEMANQLLNKHWWILAGNFLPNVPLKLLEVVYGVISKVNSNTTLDEMFP